MSTPCADREELLQALFDGELDASHALEVETHLKTCAGCAAYYNTLQALRTRLAETDLSPPASSRLRANIDAMLAAEDRASLRAGSRANRPNPLRHWLSGATAGWSAAGAMAAAFAALLVVQVAPFSTSSVASPDLEAQLVSSHVRSLLANHLIDIETSDRHVVKPWFNGRVDFAPPVPELKDAGFPLAGGRLDYADNRVVAAVVYRARAHVINLFIMPHQPDAPQKADTHRDSYSVVRWTEGDLDFWAVSDIDASELEDFHKAFVAAAPLGPA
jgi:anti-sigma factor RsiW